MRTALVTAALIAGMVANAFPFNTSFEPPEWVLGNASQNGWTDFGSGGWTITNQLARTGSQSVQYQSPAGSWLSSPDYGVIGVTTLTTVWINIAGNSATTRRFGLQGWGIPFLGSNPAITLRGDGQVWANLTSGATQEFTGIVISNPTDRWIEMSLQIELVPGGSVVGTVDGQSVNMFALTGPNPGLGSVDLYATGTGSGTAFFDDYSAVPEPLTVIGLAAGFGVLCARRRRK